VLARANRYLTGGRTASIVGGHENLMSIDTRWRSRGADTGSDREPSRGQRVVRAIQPLSLPMSPCPPPCSRLTRGWFQEADEDRVRDHLCGAALLWFRRGSNVLRPVHQCSAGLSDRGSPKTSPPARDVDYQVHDEHDRGEQVPPVER
jgi:hypothetical protein